jgi:hypothetical protein
MCNSRNLSTFVLLFLGLTGLVQQVVAQAQPTSSNLLTPEVINQLQAKAQKGDPVAQSTSARPMKTVTAYLRATSRR